MLRKLDLKVHLGGFMLRSLFILSLTLSQIIPSGVRAEYRMAVGDVIEVTVAGIPDLRQRVSVNLDGRISFPLLGPVEVSGLYLPEVQDRLRQLLSSKVYRQRTLEGREFIFVIEPDSVSVSIAEYSPIYLAGDLAKPGEQRYRPGMTIRQAVALAGGYDLLQFRTAGNPIMQSADLRNEHEVLWTEFAQQQAKVGRIEAELNNKSDFRIAEEFRKLPVAPTLLSQILSFESEKLAANRASFEKEQSSLKRQIEQSDTQFSLVTEQLGKSREGVQFAMAGLARTKELFEKGLTPSVRVNEEQRLTLAAQTQQLQATERLGQVQKDREELGRRLQRLVDQRRTDLSQELQDAKVRLTTIHSKLQAVSEKLMYTGVLRSQLTRGRGATPDIVIFRKTEKGRDRIVADEDTEVLPADTIEVTLRSALVAETPTRLFNAQ